MKEAHHLIYKHAADQNLSDPLTYANSVSTYLAFAVDKMTTTNSAICTWQTDPTRLVAAFSRQTVPMVWDYAEANPFSEAAGDFKLGVLSVTEVLERLSGEISGKVALKDATTIKTNQVYSRSFRQTRLIMTTLVMPICRIIFIRGYDIRL